MFLRIFPALALAASSWTVMAQDSTLLYTLKENERVIYRDEHRLLFGNNQLGHLLFLQRGNNHFIRYNGRDFGPYEKVGFTESNSSLFDWAVQSGGKWYQLILDKGKMYGPYESVVDVYRSDEHHPDDWMGLSGDHFGFRAFRDTMWYANIDGKEYGPYKNLDIGTPYFTSEGGTIRAFTAYDYSVRNGVYRYFATGDSVVLATLPKKRFDQRGKELYRNGEKIMDNVAQFAADESEQHYLAFDLNGVAYFDGIVLETQPRVEVGSYAGNVVGRFGFIKGSSNYYYLSTGPEGYRYVLSTGVATPPASRNSDQLLIVTRDGRHVAWQHGTNVMVDGKVVHRRGFSVVYNPQKDSFSWLSVKNRSIYVHNFKP